jgi:germination protein M
VKQVAVVVALGLALLIVTGCGNDESSGTTTGATTTEPAETGSVKAYFLRDGKVWPVRRYAPGMQAVATAALGALAIGPTLEEGKDFGLDTAIPSETEGSALWDGLEIEDGVARLSPPDLPDAALAQVVYTLTQFPTVESVEIDGKSYTRADFEDFTPSILVESPLRWDEIASPLRVTGTANTFEATFAYELTDTDGRIVDENFVTATSGTGTRGTFDFTTDAITIPFDGVGALIVFENSAQDGSRINLVEIPLRMAQ